LNAVGVSGAYVQNTAATTGFQESSSATSGAVKGVATLKLVRCMTWVKLRVFFTGRKSLFGCKTGKL
jgi:hypothetical protein